MPNQASVSLNSPEPGAVLYKAGPRQPLTIKVTGTAQNYFFMGPLVTVRSTVSNIRVLFEGGTEVHATITWDPSVRTGTWCADNVQTLPSAIDTVSIFIKWTRTDSTDYHRRGTPTSQATEVADTYNVIVKTDIVSHDITAYLLNHPRLRSQLGFELDRPTGSQSGSWLYYNDWPSAWKKRLTDFCVAYDSGEPLPISGALLLEPGSPEAVEIAAESSGFVAYCSVEAARDTYLAQVAYALWLDMTNAVPWRLEDWSDNELSYLLSSKVHFFAYRTVASDALHYVVNVGGFIDATENVLGDPRVAAQFMEREPEQGKRLVGATPSVTGQLLSGWFHDYLWHCPANFDFVTFHRDHPMLRDRLYRHNVPPIGSVYVTPRGCWSASSLFADLMRAVNVPMRKVVNGIDGALGGPEELHSGLTFAWQSSAGRVARYLLHTDQLYCHKPFYDPAPAPQDTERGVALWDHVWLDPNSFGDRFSYEPRPNVFGKATWPQWTKYLEMGQFLISAAEAISIWREGTRERFIEEMGWRGWTNAEADECWNHMMASVAAYGNGDMTLGYQRLLDGPNSRHALWCARTGKCSAP